MRCDEIKTKRIVENKRLQNIEKLRFRIVLYKKANSNEDVIEKTIEKNLQQSINVVLVIETTIKVFSIKRLMTKFSCVVKVQSTSPMI